MTGDTIKGIANNPVVALLMRSTTLLGTALAAFAVFIFMDTRQTQTQELKSIADDVKQIQFGVAVLKGESAVSNVKIDELRERMKNVESRVFQ